MAPCDAQERIRELEAENHRLSAENSGLREDAERMDWLQSNPNTAKWCSLRRSWFRMYPQTTRLDEHHTTIRSAIDAARSGK